MAAPPRPSAFPSLLLSRDLARLGDTDPVAAAELLREVERRFFATSRPLRLGNYVLVRPIGAGGFGTIYAARDPRLARDVAIKLLHPEHAAAHPELLLREAQAMARLAHPNVVRVYDVGTYEVDTDDRGGMFVVMELIDGETLHDWLNSVPRAWPQIVEVFLAAGRGLAAAHAIGLVHRDFKPGNVLLDRDGGVRVADFGLACPHDEEPGDRKAERPGTPAYMAPELFSTDATPGASADQFAFCVALFEALYGVPPFPLHPLSTRLRTIRARELANVPDGGPVPGWLHAVVVRGLDPDPALRFPDMPALLRALDPVAAPRSVGDGPAIRARIQPLESGVFRYHEVSLPSVFSIDVMRRELTRLTADGAPYTLVVDLDEANMPGPEIRQHIIGMFADPHLLYVALLTGGDPVKVLTATLIVSQIISRDRFAMFDTHDEGVAACRAVLGRANLPR